MFFFAGLFFEAKSMKMTTCMRYKLGHMMPAGHSRSFTMARHTSDSYCSLVDFRCLRPQNVNSKQYF